MELNTVLLLTTVVGALVGTIVGILLMGRKLRQPASPADASALKSKLETAESALAAANASVEDLRKQLADREQALQHNIEELKKRQEQLSMVAGEVEKSKLQRSVNDQISSELSTQNASLLKERNDLELKLEEERRLASEKASQLASLQAELDAHKRQSQELAGRIDGLTAEGAALSRFREQESRHRANLEAQLAAEQERVQQLTGQIGELERERVELERKLHQERESAARGMELLLMAKENFSRVLTSPANGEIRPGEIREVPVEAPIVHDDAPVELLDDVSTMPVD